MTVEPSLAQPVPTTEVAWTNLSNKPPFTAFCSAV
jgi:hypothetical protein